MYMYSCYSHLFKVKYDEKEKQQAVMKWQERIAISSITLKNQCDQICTLLGLETSPMGDAVIVKESHQWKQKADFVALWV